MPGNDTDVKKYLANCLQGLKENYMRLNKEYTDNKMNLTQRLESAQQVGRRPQVCRFSLLLFLNYLHWT
jgi:hypothetical protein